MINFKPALALSKFLLSRSTSMNMQSRVGQPAILKAYGWSADYAQTERPIQPQRSLGLLPQVKSP
jgi:hypothetical protein